MAEQLPGDPSIAEQHPEMIKVAVVVDRPSAESLAELNRGQKYRALKQNSAEIRDQLIKWIEEHDLAEEVAQVGEPTAFNMLFVVSTPQAAKQLEQAPGVVSVSISPDLVADDLPQPGDKRLLP